VILSTRRKRLVARNRQQPPIAEPAGDHLDGRVLEVGEVFARPDRGQTHLVRALHQIMHQTLLGRKGTAGREGAGETSAV